MKYYVVAIGKKPGIYTTWKECSQYVTGYKGAKHKSFSVKEEAEKYYSAFHGGAFPKNKQYEVSATKGTCYKNTDNCLLCGKPFKQTLGKGGTRRSSSCCPACRKERLGVKTAIYKATNGAVKGLSIDELIYLKGIIGAENIFEHLIKHPWDALKKAKRDKRDTALSALLSQRKSYAEDSSVKSVPLYIKECFGKDKDIVSIKGDKRNPVITYHCKRCDCDYRVYWRRYQKTKGHNCSALISSGEAIVEDYLKKCGIAYATQRDTLKCINPDTGYVMPYDFEILNKKLLIEVQGEQHRNFVECFHIDQEGFEYQKKKDTYKKKFAEENGYRLLELWYEDFKGDVYMQYIDEAINEV